MAKDGISQYNNFNKSYHMRTVCEVNREVYELITLNRCNLGYLYNQIMQKLDEMMIMQKKMDAKLKEYKSNYENEMYKENPGWQTKDAVRKSFINIQS